MSALAKAIRYTLFPEEQGSPEWHARRAGHITASSFDKIITPAKLAPSAQCDAYLDRVLESWLLRQPADEEFAGSYWTDRGEQMEPEARRAAEFALGLRMVPVGFAALADGRAIGCSVDSMVHDADGLPVAVLELKCPRLSTHIGYWRDTDVPRSYWLQVQGQLWVTGLEIGYFQSYHPDGPLVLRKFSRDEKVQKALDEHLAAAHDRLLELQSELRAAGCEPRDPDDAPIAGEWEGAA